LSKYLNIQLPQMTANIKEPKITPTGGFVLLSAGATAHRSTGNAAVRGNISLTSR